MRYPCILRDMRKILLTIDPKLLNAVEAETARRTAAAGVDVPRAAVIRDLLVRGLKDAERGRA